MIQTCKSDCDFCCAPTAIAKNMAREEKNSFLAISRPSIARLKASGKRIGMSHRFLLETISGRNSSFPKVGQPPLIILLLYFVKENHYWLRPNQKGPAEFYEFCRLPNVRASKPGRLYAIQVLNFFAI
jgi:hypothetical protein